MGTDPPHNPDGRGQDSQSHFPRAITQKALAERLGLHQSTVSRALRGALPPETVARVRALAEELGYDPAYHESARRLALRRRGKEELNHVVCCLGPQVTTSRYFSEIFRGIVDEASHVGYAVLALTVDHPPHHVTQLPSAMARGEVDGLVLMAPEPALVREMQAAPGFRGRPMITLFRVLSGCRAVYSDDRKGAYESVHHLLSLGHRHILHVSHSERRDPRLSIVERMRYEGWLQAYQDFGLDPETHWRRVAPYLGWFSPQTLPPRIGFGLSRDSARAHPLIGLLREHPEITAILGVNDANALHAWHILQAAGLRIPQDMSLVGFDDTDPMPGDHRENLLSSVRIPLEDIGRESVRMILSMLQDEIPSDSHSALPTTFMPRKSVGPPRERPFPFP